MKKTMYTVIDVEQGNVMKTDLTLLEAHHFVKRHEIRSRLRIRPKKEKTNWSTETPTEPGYYMAKIDSQGCGYLCSVYFDGGCVFLMNTFLKNLGVVRLWGPQIEFPILPRKEKENMRVYHE